MDAMKPGFAELFRLGLGRKARLAETMLGRGWIDAGDAGRARDMCALLPGDADHMLAVTLGCRAGGVPGGVAAGLGAVLPMLFALLAASVLVAVFGGVPAVAGALRGLAGGALAMILVAAFRQARRSLTHPVLYGFAAASLLMGFGLRLKFYGIIIVAVLIGIWMGQNRPDIFHARPPEAATPGEGAPVIPMPGGWRRAGWLGLWFGAAWLLASLGPRLVDGPEGLAPRLLNFGVRAGFFAFGGAYGALSFFGDMSQRFSWGGQGPLALGLGLAGLTPGPLLLAAQHGAFVESAAHAGALPSLSAGCLGALCMSLGLFLPGFYLPLTLAPRMEAVLAKGWLRAAVTGVDAAMVGVLCKIGLVFGAAVLWPAGFAAGPLDALPLAAGVVCLPFALRRGAVARIGLVAAGVIGAVWGFLA